MRNVFLATVAALAAMAAFASSAWANLGDTIHLSPGGNVTATAAGTLTLGGIINCDPISLGANLASQIVQTASLMLVGAITIGTTSGCGFGNTWRFNNVANMRVWAFLPISSSSINLRITGWDWTIIVFGGITACRYQGNPMVTSDGLTLTFVNQPLVLISGGFPCPNPGNLNGTMAFGTLQIITVLRG